MLTITLQAIPAQITRLVLDNQNFQIYLYTTNNGLLIDVSVNGNEIANGIICCNGIPLICATYLDVKGNLVFIDTQGSDNPVYTGIGTRFQLIYLTSDEYSTFIQQ